MAELIDKERAYKALKHEQYTHGLSFSAEAFEKAARIIDQMPTIESEQVRRWIPCSERLPEEGVSVICYMRIGEIVVMEYNGDGWYSGITRYNPRAVTHWMYIPEPPKEDET